MSGDTLKQLRKWGNQAHRPRSLTGGVDIAVRHPDPIAGVIERLVDCFPGLYHGDGGLERPLTSQVPHVGADLSAGRRR